MVSLKLFGGAALKIEGEAVTGPPTQRHRLALLALLAASPSRALTRDKLVAYLWPDRGARAARKLLNQSVYALRKALGEGVLLSIAEELRLDTSRVHCDVIAFDEALGAGRLERAVRLYRGPFLDGFFLDGASGFEHWVEGERGQLADAYAGALEELAESAGKRGELRSAVEWWKARAAHDPYDSRVALRLMELLDAAGNPAGALKHAADHERRLTEDLGIDSPPEVRRLVERLRGVPSRVGPRDEGRNRAIPRGRPSPSLSSRNPRISGPISPSSWATDSDAAQSSKRNIGIAAGAVLLGFAVFAGWWLSLAPAGPPSGADGVAIPLSDVETVVSRMLDRRMGNAAPAPGREARTENIAAYELYLRGTDPALLRNDSTAREGVEYLRQAVALDSTYAPPWAGLACLYLRLTADVGMDTPREEVHRLAEEAALRAVVLDDSLPEAHASLGLVRMAGFDFSTAERHLTKAIELNPRRTRPREWLVAVYLATGRPAEAMAEAGEALDVDPLSPTANAELARALGFNGRCDEALARLRRLVSLQPPLLRAGTIAAHCYALTGRLSEAIRVLRAQVEGSSDPHSLALLGHMLGRAGQREEAVRILDDLRTRWRRNGGGAFSVAVVVAGLEDSHDEAFGWLERALEDGSLIGTPLHLQLLRTLADGLGEDPRLEELDERLGLRVADAGSGAV